MMLGGFYHGGQVIGGIDAFATDKTPVGTVISVGCAKTGEVAGKTTPTGAFPTKDYLVCDNATYNITDYPKLANYFEEAYGSKNYFGGNGTTTFAVPNWQASFPVNGVLCIKAQISSNQISLAEIDDDTPNTNMVYSSAKVEDIANDLDSRVTEVEGDVEGINNRLNATVLGKTVSTGATIAANGYVSLADASLAGKNFQGVNINNIAAYNVYYTSAYIGPDGFHINLINKGASQVTTGPITCYYKN